MTYIEAPWDTKRLNPRNNRSASAIPHRPELTAWRQEADVNTNPHSLNEVLA